MKLVPIQQPGSVLFNAVYPSFSDQTDPKTLKILENWENDRLLQLYRWGYLKYVL